MLFNLFAMRCRSGNSQWEIHLMLFIRDEVQEWEQPMGNPFHHFAEPMMLAPHYLNLCTLSFYFPALCKDFYWIHDEMNMIQEFSLLNPLLIESYVDVH